MAFSLDEKDFSNRHQKLEDQRNQIQKGLYGESIEKGGEGSRGGEVIGHTKSGKPIYENANHPEHNHFSSKDHEEASEKHLAAAKQHEHIARGLALNKKEQTRHNDIAEKHKNYAADHARLADRMEDK